MKNYFPSKFQHELGIGDTVSASYNAITDVYNSILRCIDKFQVFEIRKINSTTVPLLMIPILNLLLIIVNCKYIYIFLHSNITDY